MDDDFDFGTYNPSVGKNSRSGSMKQKLARKPTQTQNDKKSHKQSNDFDQLDDLLNGDLLKDKKKDNSLNKNTSSSLNKKNDSIDAFFDQPPSTKSYLNNNNTLNITSKIQSYENRLLSPKNKNMDLARTSINFKADGFNDIIDQDSHKVNSVRPGTSSRQRSKSPTANNIKLPQQSLLLNQTHTSMRNMRPPLKRKQSVSGLNTNNMNLGLSLPQQKKQTISNNISNNIQQKKQIISNNISNNNININISKQPSQYSKLNLNLNQQIDDKPSKSMNLGRRGSIDNKSQKRFQTGLTLLGEQKNQKNEQPVSHFKIFDKNQLKSQKQKTFKVNNLIKTNNNNISQMQIGKSIIINEKTSNFNIKQSIIDSNYSFQRVNNNNYKINEPPKLHQMNAIIQQQTVNNSSSYQKQLDYMKSTYQKQLQYLQQSLDKQLKSNQQTRDRLIKQSNTLIQQQRKRSSRIHDEQIKRLKQIHQWQIKKIEDSYKFQINNLKSTLEKYQNYNPNQHNPHIHLNDNNKFKKQIQRLQQQLNLQKKILIDRQHHLTKRQLQLQQSQADFNNKKRRQQQNYRQQQKILLQKQTKAKSNILNQKKYVTEEKQKIALEAANMELDIIRRKQKLDLLIKQAQMEKQAVQNQRHQVRILNQQMMARYKQKMDELSSDKQRVNNLQAQLIRKLRIIQLKCSDPTLNQTSQNATYNPYNTTMKQNITIKERPQSSMAQKQLKLNQTSQRYNKVQKVVNKTMTNNMNKTFTLPLQNKSGQGFKLQNYLMSMNKYQKARYNNFL